MMDIENIRNIVTKKLILLETKFGYKMPRIHKEINDELERNSHYSHVPQFSSHSNWGKIRNGNGNYNVDWWLELETIIDAVTLKASTRINSKNEIIKTDSSARKKIIWGLTKFQDTIIPKFYNDGYGDLGLNFDISRNWNEVFDIIENDIIHIALHNFSTAICISNHLKQKKIDDSVFFFPLFLFKGYGMLVRKKHILEFCNSNNISTVDSIKKLKPQERKLFLESAKVIFEPQTDVEWVFNKYYNRCNVDWNKMTNNNIINLSINDGKNEYLNNPDIGIYFTNSFPKYELMKNIDFELIDKVDLTNHENLNGIICKMSFYENNKNTIDDIINLWFKNLKHFDTDLTDILASTELDMFDFHNLRGLQNALNKHTFSNLELDEIARSFKSNNEFFNSKSDALKIFSEIKNEVFLEIANIQLNDMKIENELGDKIIKELINNSKNNK